MNRDIGWRTLATWLMKRLGFGCRKREPLGVPALMAGGVGEVCGFAKNRDAAMPGTGGESAAPAMNRDIGR
jgi:hypothetical protein